MSAFPDFFLASMAFLLGVRVFFRSFGDLFSFGLGMGSLRRQIRSVYACLLEFEETLGSGAVPLDEKWLAISHLPPPWGTLAFDSLKQLRTHGGALLPTLKRLRALASEQLKTLGEAQARSAQAVAQALGGLFFVILFGVTLYEILPGVSESTWLWLALCAAAFFSAVLGALWILSMSENARWAGLPRGSKNWILATQCAGERFLALVRAGNPADLAWNQACQLLTLEAPELALAWGHSIWKSPSKELHDEQLEEEQLENDSRPTARNILIQAGEAMRKAVQVSLMEGRPCTERVEAVLLSVSYDIRARIDAELSLLPARALKPLFLFVAPGIFLLLAGGLYLCFENGMGT